ncbi:hypothetical protein CPB84DRAFT_550934 [Gymnopilus junonius]|uniref:Uncharacterized protein n=1 Tax=Gymnopilus junonius TaxID=109634 RepID=A0A9P5NC83_GYMJU|nr:hypothetical protein CPB84DRAFT_550934 [Gymnopilus junonius]
MKAIAPAFLDHPHRRHKQTCASARQDLSRTWECFVRAYLCSEVCPSCPYLLQVCLSHTVCFISCSPVLKNS